MQEIKRINRIRRRLVKDSNTKEAGKTGPMKTLLVRVMTPDLRERLERLRKKSENIPPSISNTSRANLNKLLTDYTEMKETVLKFCYDEFKQNLTAFMLKAAKKAYEERHGLELTPCNDTEGRQMSSGFICPGCQTSTYLYERDTKLGNRKEKKLFYAKCIKNECTALPIQLNPVKITDEDGNNFTICKIGKFADKSIQGYIYKDFIKRKSKRYLIPMNFYHSKSVGDIFGKSIAGTICSFLSKYQDIIFEHQKTVKENEKRLANLKNGASANGLVFPEIILPSQLHFKEGIEAYNDVVARITIWVNLNLWQKLKLARDEAKPLLRLKGFPSFPVVERLENEVDWWDRVNKVKELIDKKREIGKAFWCSASEEKRKDVLENYKYLPIENDYKKAEGCLQNPKKPAKRQLGDLLLHLAKKHNGDWGKVFDEIWDRIDKKLKRLIEHIKKQEENKKQDNQSKATLTDWLRAMASFVLEGLKETDENGFTENALRLKKWYGDLRGNPFAVQTENRLVDIGGFSIGSDGKSIQYRSVLAWKYKDNGYRDFYLLMNYGKKGRIKFTDGTNTKVGGKWQGLLYAGGSAKVVDLNFKSDDEQLIILPLAFGKRQGREFIWNDLLSLETGLLKLANGRVIEKTLYNKKTGNDEATLFVALTFERREVLDPLNIKPMNLIGIDRGENIPAVIALTDPEGCPLAKFKDSSGNPTYILRIGEGYKGKQRAIQAAKEVEQRRGGGYSRKYASKAKNLADDMVRNAARDLFYHAVTQDAVLVFENLTRGFGRQGKRTFMTERQYTKMEDWLMAKLAYEGLPYKTYLRKTIAQYTSKTCSNCGFVITNADYEKMLDGIKKTTGGWVTALNGKELKAEGQITYYNRYKRQNVTKDLSVELDRLWGESGNSDIHSWTKGRREEALFLLKKQFSHRPVQEKFVCLDCGFEAHADEQAALNIARSWLFLGSQEYKKYQSGEKTGNNDKRAFVEAWQSFYKRKLKEVWKRNG